MGLLAWDLILATCAADDTPAPRYQETHRVAEATNTKTLSTEDTDIVARIHAGDCDAFRDLYTKSYPALLGFAVASYCASAEAEEIVQDVFAAVWERRTLWNPQGSIAAYLFAAVRNRVIKARAHHAVVTHAEQDGDAVTARSVGQKPLRPDDAAEADELRRAIAHAVAALPERRRLALALRFGQGMSYTEIGQILGVSEHAATLLVARARETLAPLLRVFRAP